MRVVHVPMLQDNYAYLLVDETTGKAAVIDPAEGEVALEAAARERVELIAILNTHHHWDHTGGNEVLIAARPDLTVVGFEADKARIPGITHPVREGDRVFVGSLEGRVLPVPCHTSGHVAYLFRDALFSGDTLFAAGCGRFFEGTALEMHHALYEVLGSLPDHTRVYCGHEYTENNLRFALTLEPSNPEIHAKLSEVRALRAEGRPSVPTTIGEEKTYNPFLRVSSPELVEHVLRSRPGIDPADPVAVLEAVRALKDVF